MSLSHRKRKRELRFVGTGNVVQSLNPPLLARGWQITCCRCSKKSKILRNLPPQALIKKFTQAGWLVANEPLADLCSDCQRKPATPQSNIGFAKKVIRDALRPMVPVNGHQIHFNDLVVAAKALTPDQIKELIVILREQLPKKTVNPRKPKPLPELDTEYERWLNEQDG